MGNALDVSSDDDNDNSGDSKWLSISLEEILNDSFVESLDLTSHPLPKLFASTDSFSKDHLSCTEEEIFRAGRYATMRYVAQLHANTWTHTPQTVHDFDVSKC
jgi:hypothetical protein